MTHAVRRRVLVLLAALLVALALGVVLLLPPPGQGTAMGPPPLDYVGVTTCETCHAAEAKRWRGSHHDLAMQKPDAKTVQGDFGGRSFEHDGVVTSFSRKDGRYLVRTE